MLLERRRRQRAVGAGIEQGLVGDRRPTTITGQQGDDGGQVATGAVAGHRDP